MAKISGIDIPELTFQEDSAPSTPASTKWKVYAKTDGLYYMADTGSETGPLAAAAGATAFVGCRVYNAGTQSVSDTTDTAVLFASEEYDTDGIHDTGSNTSRLTVPGGMGGYWQFSGMISYASNTTGMRTAKWRLDGTTDQRAQARMVPVTGSQMMVVTAPTIVLSLTAGQYVELMAYQNSTGSLNIGHASALTVQCWAAATYLGA